MRNIIYVVLVGGLVFGCRRSETDPKTSGKELASVLATLVGSGEKPTLLERAERGDATSQFELGLKFAKGDGVEKNLDEAARWYRKAADQGNASAQCNLGFCYYNGFGIPKDLSEAFRFFELSASQGITVAQANLASMYDLGEATEKNEAKAFKLLQHAANGGLSHAQYLVGARYETGLGVVKNYETARKWFFEGANSGDVDAQVKLGIFCAIGRGGSQDREGATKWLSQAKSNGANLVEMQERARARASELVDHEATEIVKHIAKYRMKNRNGDLPPLYVIVGDERIALSPDAANEHRVRVFDMLKTELQITRPFRECEHVELIAFLEIIESVLKQ